MVEIVAAQRRVAVRREHLEHAARELQDRDVEGAAAEVVDRVRPLRRIVEAVGDRRRRRFVQQPQHLEAGEIRGVLGRLPLRIVEIGGHGDDGARELAAEARLGSSAQRPQDLRRYLDRTLDAGACGEPDHSGLIDEAVRKAAGVGQVREAAAHQPLHRNDRVLRVARLHRLRGVPDVDAGLAIADDRRQQRMAALVRKHDGDAVAHGRDQRVRRAEVDADRPLALVRRGRSIGLGDLQQRHQCSEWGRRRISVCNGGSKGSERAGGSSVLEQREHRAEIIRELRQETQLAHLRPRRLPGLVDVEQ